MNKLENVVDYDMSRSVDGVCWWLLLSVEIDWCCLPWKWLGTTCFPQIIVLQIFYYDLILPQDCHEQTVWEQLKSGKINLIWNSKKLLRLWFQYSRIFSWKLRSTKHCCTLNLSNTKKSREIKKLNWNSKIKFYVEC